MAQPVVSAVMTVYNGGDHLKEAVQSVLGQSFTDFEFVIVDNASTDDSIKKIEAFNDPRVRLFKNQTNEGQTRALNRAIKEARGEFIARMDADDVCFPGRFEAQLEFMRNHPDIGVVGSWHDEIDDNGRFLKLMRYPTDPLEIKCNLISDGNLTLRCFAHPTAFFRAAVLREMGGYDESIAYAQDYDLWTRLSRSHAIANIDRPLLKYRSSRKSASQTFRPEMAKELDRIVSANVRRIWPDIGDREENLLVQMLRNRPIRGPVSAAELYALFDRLFERQFQGEELTPRHLQLRERIKAYYTPRLIAKSPLPAIAFLARCVVHQPAICFDHKIQKNFFKGVHR